MITELPQHIEPNSKRILVRCLYKSDIAAMYGTTLPTLRKLFKQHEAELGYLRDRRQLFPADIELIFKLLGEPQYYDRYVLKK